MKAEVIFHARSITGSINRKTDQLLKIKQVRDVYEKALMMEHTFKPETDPIDKAYMVKEIILRLGEGPEIQEMANLHDEELDIEIPRTRSKKAMETYANDTLDASHKQTLKALDLGLKLHTEKRLKLKWPDLYDKDTFLHIGNYKPYYEFTKLLAAANFVTKDRRNSDVKLNYSY